jgi:hypothetical protein
VDPAWHFPIAGNGGYWIGAFADDDGRRMIAAKIQETPEPTGQGLLSGRWRLPRPISTLFLFAVALLVLAPLASLIAFAIHGDAELWPHLAAYVLPVATLNTVLLLGGVAVICAVVGVGTAWLVTAYDFPGRSVFVWLLPLPLALPTYIVAYVYAELLGGVGPVQTALRGLLVSKRALARRRYPSDEPGALPLRLSRDSRDVSDAERGANRDGARARRRNVASHPRYHHPAGAAGDCGRARAGDV